MKNFDIAIIGGGIVGLAFACSLQDIGLRIIVLEYKSPVEISFQDALMDLRVSSINVASEKFLVHLGVWSKILSHQISCYHKMEIWDKDSFGHIIIDSKKIGYTHLGHIIANKVIYKALLYKAKKCKNIKLIAPAKIKEIIWKESNTSIILEIGDVITTSLVVGADGANSWLRKKANIPLTLWNYKHNALVANIRTSEPHNAVARQIFYNDGILAFLPLKDPYLCSICWSLSSEKVKQMQNMKKKRFNQILCTTFDNRLGLCKLEGDRKVFQLIGRYAHKFAGHRLAFLGDAAHTIHPFGGQGMNLGFMDAAKLAKEVCRLHYEGKDIGKYLYLRRYERSRKCRTVMMLTAMQGILELFSGTNLMKKFLRDISLKFAGIVPIVRIQILRQIIGLNDFPD